MRLNRNFPHKALALLLQASLFVAAASATATASAKEQAGSEALAAANSVAAAAQPPAQAAFDKTAGVVRQQVGNLQVTALLDGVLWLPPSDLKGLDADKTSALLQQANVRQTDAGVQTDLNVYLVQRADRLMLVDAGAGKCMGSGVGKLPEKLRHAGVSPASVTDVLLTHAHPDHVCGLVNDHGQIVYPKATVWLSEEEAAYWFNPESKAAAPEALRPFFDMVLQALQPYAQAGQLRRINSGDQTGQALPPGVRMLASAGHTPGHVSWLIEDDATNERKQGIAPETLFVWGDVVHYYAVQFAHPQAWPVFDSQPDTAVAMRRKLLRQAAEKGWLVAGAHLPFPGLGHVMDAPAVEQEWRWVPVKLDAAADQ